jgi:predicted dehydrogenase
VACDALDSYHAVLEFESGLTGLLHGTPLGWNAILGRLEVHGDAGSYLEERVTTAGGDSSRRLIAERETGQYRELQEPLEDATAARPGVPAMNIALAERFVSAILDGSEMRPSFEDGYRVQQLIEAAIRASEAGARQPIDTAPVS